MEYCDKGDLADYLKRYGETYSKKLDSG